MVVGGGRAERTRPQWSIGGRWTGDAPLPPAEGIRRAGKRGKVRILRAFPVRLESLKASGIAQGREAARRLSGAPAQARTVRSAAVSEKN